jgi:hypothetical protein
MMALVRVLDVLPITDPLRAEYVQTVQHMAATLKSIQRMDGFWNSDLGDSLNYGGKEETGTSMFTYGIAWGINHGILDTAAYLPVVTRAWNGMADSCIHPMADSVILGWVQGTGSKPSDGQPLSYWRDANFDDYTVGSFLLAGSEVYKLAKNTVALQRPEKTKDIMTPDISLSGNILRFSKTVNNNYTVVLFDLRGRQIVRKTIDAPGTLRLSSMAKSGAFILKVESNCRIIAHTGIIIAQ